MKDIKRRYSDKNFEANKIITRNVWTSYDMRKHMKNVLAVVIGGTRYGETRFYGKVKLYQANTSFVVLDPKGENLRDFGYLLEKKGMKCECLI